MLGDKQKVLCEMAQATHELHMSLDPKPKHHGYITENRGLSPEHREFSFHIHPTEDLLAFLDDVNAVDDPEDRTIGEGTTTKVLSVSDTFTSGVPSHAMRTQAEICSAVIPESINKMLSLRGAIPFGAFQ